MTLTCPQGDLPAAEAGGCPPSTSTQRGRSSLHFIAASCHLEVVPYYQYPWRLSLKYSHKSGEDDRPGVLVQGEGLATSILQLTPAQFLRLGRGQQGQPPEQLQLKLIIKQNTLFLLLSLTTFPFEWKILIGGFCTLRKICKFNGFLFSFVKIIKFKFVHEVCIKTNKEKSTEIFPPILLKSPYIYNLYMRT